jgi:hypothetical protein
MACSQLPLLCRPPPCPGMQPVSNGDSQWALVSSDDHRDEEDTHHLRKTIPARTV